MTPHETTDLNSSDQPPAIGEAFTHYARHVVHDVANAANAVSTHLQLIEILAADHPALQAPLQRALVDVDKLVATLKARLYLPSMPISTAVAMLYPAKLVDRIFDEIGAQATLDNRVDRDDRWDVSESLMSQALAAVLDNASRATTSWVRCGADSSGPGRVLWVENPVADADNWRRWRQPFFTTRSTAGALGLGLNMADHAMGQMGGSLELDVDDGVCRVALSWP